MNRRTFLRVGLGSGVATSGGYLGRGVLFDDLHLDWGYGRLRDGEGVFVEGGLNSSNPDTEYFTTLLTNETAVGRLNPEVVGDGMASVRDVDFGEQFLLVVESRTTAASPVRLALAPDGIERSGLRSASVESFGESVDVPDDLGTQSLVYSSVTAVDRDPLPTPSHVRVNVYEAFESDREVTTFGSD